jgi:hypothetical protein
VHDGGRHVAMRIAIIDHGQRQLRQSSVGTIRGVADTLDDCKHQAAGHKRG